MRTSQLAIIAIMVIVLGALSFIYLSENREIKANLGKERTALLVPDDIEIRKQKLESQSQLAKAEKKIADLEKEISLLRIQLHEADSRNTREGSYTLTGEEGSSPLAAENNRLKSEIDRLNQAMKMMNLEGSLIMKNDVDRKEEEIRMEQFLGSARTVAKVEGLNLDHNLVIIAPIGQPNFNTSKNAKDKLLIRRNGKLVARITVDSMDAESSNYITHLDADVTRAEAESIQKGDEIIFPLKSNADTLPEEPEDPAAALPAVPASFGGAGSGLETADDGMPELPGQMLNN